MAQRPQLLPQEARDALAIAASEPAVTTLLAQGYTWSVFFHAGAESECTSAQCVALLFERGGNIAYRAVVDFEGLHDAGVAERRLAERRGFRASRRGFLG
ncbi:MAG: hypothetical protein QM756_38455 [Polyangiaceae bacterium]